MLSVKFLKEYRFEFDLGFTLSKTSENLSMRCTLVHLKKSMQMKQLEVGFVTFQYVKIKMSTALTWSKLDYEPNPHTL